MASQATIKSGPVGGATGTPWDFNHNTSNSNVAISDIVINADPNSFVNSITITAIDRKTKRVVNTQSFGGNGGTPNDVPINWPDEIVTRISGTTAWVSNPGTSDYLAIQSLGVQTNKKTYGPFGKTDGTSFQIPVENGEVVGFFGRAGTYIDAIGLYLLPSTNL